MPVIRGADRAAPAWRKCRYASVRRRADPTGIDGVRSYRSGGWPCPDVVLVNTGVPVMKKDGDMDDEHGELIYEPLVYVDRRTTERNLGAQDAQIVAKALLAASLEDEGPGWVFAQCLAMTDDPRVDVRWAVALAIGHLARPGGFVDEAPARNALQALATDPAVQPAVLDALDDLEVALRAGRDEE